MFICHFVFFQLKNLPGIEQFPRALEGKLEEDTAKVVPITRVKKLTVCPNIYI